MNSNHLAAYESQLTPNVLQVLKGIQRHQSHTSCLMTRLPITIQIMLRINGVFQQHPHRYHNIMMWSACCVAFSGFLRCNEFTVPSQTSCNPAIHLSYSDVATDDQDHPTLVVITIKQSKTDTLCTGAHISIGITQDDICLVKALMPYLAMRGAHPGPLFILENC